MGEEVSEPAVDDALEREPKSGAGEAAQPLPAKRGWRPSSRTISVAAVVVVVTIVLSVLTTVIVDQVTRITVPQAEGEPLADAIAAVEDSGLETKIVTESDFCEDDVRAAELCVVQSQRPEPAERVHTDRTVVLEVVPMDVVVPEMSGMSLDEAQAASAGIGITVEAADPTADRVDGFEEWKILEQTATGSMAAGESVYVTLDRPLVDAPDVVGLPLEAALDQLTVAGFEPRPAGPPADDYDPAWVVTATNPAAMDGKLPIASSVKLEWGVKVPNVVGATDLAATSTLSNAGLEVSGSTSGSQKVSSQQPKAGTIVEPGSDVAITLEAPSIVYEVVGNGSRASITWIAPGTYNISQATNEPLPWRKSWPGDSSYRNFNAQILDGTSITCNIYVNGQRVRTNTSTGQYAVVSCG
ncbi:PASTA domain-containing protein [Microbacterium thalassium]|uniref:PASTA domain-containing protein n=1 Tax=Microbacterium TaxID=33882 RepID=UPI00146C89E8|nr:PASTA domain-containing protein [Microbacterium thalassium]